MKSKILWILIVLGISSVIIWGVTSSWETLPPQKGEFPVSATRMTLWENWFSWWIDPEKRVSTDDPWKVDSWRGIPTNLSGSTLEDYRQYFQKRIRDSTRVSMRNVFETYDLFSEKDTLFLRGCHKIAHSMGHEILERYGFEMAMSMIPYESCTGGFVHGVIEETVLTDDRFREHPETTCESFTWGMDQINCVHGVGHGLMFIESANVEKSLSRCTLFHPRSLEIACAQWVFMEYFIWDRDHLIHPELATTTDPTLLCENLTGREMRDACAFYLPLAYFQKDTDRGWVFLYCRKSSLLADRCLYGASRELTRQLFGDPVTSDRLCSNLPENEKSLCYQGIVDHVLFRGYDKEYVEREYCAKMSWSGRASCTRALEKLEKKVPMKVSDDTWE